MTEGAAKNRRVVGVLTGDLVRSSSLNAVDLARARAAVEGAGEDIAGWRAGAVVGSVEFFRGDAWQLALGNAELFLRAAIFVRARLRAANMNFDSRIGVGLGACDELNQHRVSLSTGEAFTISGRTLDSLTGVTGIAVDVPKRVAHRLGWVAPFAGLCSALVDRWTERQAELVCRMLLDTSVPQKELAIQLQVTPQAVSKHLGAADFNSLAAAITYVEKVDWRSELTRKGVRFVKI